MTGPSRPEQTNWIAVAAIIGAAVVASFQVGKMPAALPVIRAEFELSLVAAGWMISIFNVLGVSLAIFAGAFTDWLGHRRAIIFGLVAVAAASTLGAVAPGAGMLLLSRFLEGFGFIIVTVVGPALLTQVTAERDQRLAFGFWAGYWPTGAAIIMLMSTQLIEPIGWRGLWLVDAGLVLAMAAVVAWVTEASGPTQVRRWGQVASGIVRTLTSRGPLTLAAVFAAYTVVYMSTISFLPTLLVEQLGITLVAAATLTAGVVFCNAFGNVLGGLALHRGVARWVLLAIGFVVMGVAGFGVFNGALPLEIRVVSAVLVSFVGGLIPVSCIAGAPVHAPAPHLLATTNGLLVQGANLGQFGGPPATAAAVQAVGSWGIAAFVLAASTAVGIALSMVVRRLERVRHGGGL